MSVLYGLSSLPGLPLPDDPAHYALMRWVSPAAQNALHVPAYATLSLTWSWALRAWLRAPVGTWAVGGAIASAYGALDEWHQSFVPGRYASLVDVLLDVLGAVLGSWLAARLAASKDTISG